ncbi:flagellar biosynthetic protein FliO [Rubrivirga sp. S365]|uniref:Flagellar biosynthetic protein FliO n=1 Tax=Rubrivirga litoralis TaxID=3075598 RepID=A0ABU3BPP2_9BACT|nr:MULTISPECIES: flagellar biosynthetic protein FliO [unclassified Rubrivirga]MDT0631256.1 flagellar biosynthetic protein FliO [Rubrivirga sp. F394]MDT7856041.1 flagellar biosynthetic protein FliO [Rubrivirga sp. S365]
MFRLPSLPAFSRRPLSPWRRAALFGAGLLVLWLALQLAPGAPAPAPSEARPADVAERLPVRDGAGPVAAHPAPRERAGRGLLSVGNLAALLLLAGGGAWAVFLRHRPSAGGAEGPAPTLRSLDALALAPGQSLRLVAVGDEVLLLGLAQGGVSLIRHYAAGEAPALAPAPPDADTAALAPPDATAPAATAPPRAPGFADLLRHAQTAPVHHG